MGSLRAGAAVEDITPAAGAALVGYSRDSASQGILDRLEVAALVLDAGPRFVWLSVDHIGPYWREVLALRDAVGAACEVPPARVMVSFTHTHSGPEAEAEYLQLLVDKAAAAGRSAVEGLRDARLGWEVVNAEAAVHRRPTDDQGRAYMGSCDTAVDGRVGVLRVDAADGRPIATVIRYSAHANVLKSDNLLVSADWPGAARRRLGERLGCPVLVSNGSAGDVNPRWRGSPGDLSRMSLAIAAPVEEAFAAIETRADAAVAVATRTVELPLRDLPDPAERARIALEVEREWEVDTQEWQREVARRWTAGQRRIHLPVEVQVAKIGGGLVAGIPMEPFTALGLGFAARFPGSPAFLNGYTNGWVGYLPARDEIARGGYEVSWAPVSHGTPVGWLTPIVEGAGEHVVAVAAALARAL